MKWGKGDICVSGYFNGMCICLHFKGLFFHEICDYYFFAKSMFVRDDVVIYLLQLCVRGKGPIFIFFSIYTFHSVNWTFCSALARHTYMPSDLEIRGLPLPCSQRVAEQGKKHPQEEEPESTVQPF